MQEINRASPGWSHRSDRQEPKPTRTQPAKNPTRPTTGLATIAAQARCPNRQARTSPVANSPGAVDPSGSGLFAPPHTSLSKPSNPS
ncbi:MAG: hypothetical protein ACK56F_28505, partial [bacterium]